MAMIGEEPELAGEQAVDAPRLTRDGPPVAVPGNRSAVRDRFLADSGCFRLKPCDIASESEPYLA